MTTAKDRKDAVAKRTKGQGMKGTRPQAVIQDEVQGTYGMSVSNLVGRQYASDRRDFTIPTVRVTAAMAEGFAEFSNTHNLSPSDAVRSLLQIGLDHQECTNDE